MYRFLADGLVVVHLAFIAFAVGGAFLALRWPRVVWLHIPAAAWAALIEFAGWICPLTPLENQLRFRGGEAGYSGEFVEHYLLSILYPAGLTRPIQIGLGALVLVLNLAAYGYVFYHRRQRQEDHKIP